MGQRSVLLELGTVAGQRTLLHSGWQEALERTVSHRGTHEAEKSEEELAKQSAIRW